jgi:hypothetical protein
MHAFKQMVIFLAVIPLVFGGPHGLADTKTAEDPKAPDSNFLIMFNVDAYELADSYRQEIQITAESRSNVKYHLPYFKLNYDKNNRLEALATSLSDKYFPQDKQVKVSLDTLFFRMFVAIKTAKAGFYDYSLNEFSYLSEELVFINSILNESEHNDKEKENFLKDVLREGMIASIEMNGPYNSGEKKRIGNYLAQGFKKWENPEFWKSSYKGKYDERFSDNISVPMTLSILAGLSGLVMWMIFGVPSFIDTKHPSFLEIMVAAFSSFAVFAGTTICTLGITKPLGANPLFESPHLCKDFSSLMSTSQTCQEVLGGFYPRIKKDLSGNP